MECSCDKCVSCCYNMPGIPTPDDVLNICAFLKIDLEKAFPQFFMLQWYDNLLEDKYVELIVPAHDVSRAPDPDELEKMMVKDRQREKEWGRSPNINCPGGRTTWGYPLAASCFGPCIFLSEDNRCKIHEVKPTTCRLIFGCKQEKEDYRIPVLKEWDTEKGRGLVKYLAGSLSYYEEKGEI